MPVSRSCSRAYMVHESVHFEMRNDEAYAMKASTKNPRGVCLSVVKPESSVANRLIAANVSPARVRLEAAAVAAISETVFLASGVSKAAKGDPRQTIRMPTRAIGAAKVTTASRACAANPTLVMPAPGVGDAANKRGPAIKFANSRPDSVEAQHTLESTTGPIRGRASAA